VDDLSDVADMDQFYTRMNECISELVAIRSENRTVTDREFSQTLISSLATAPLVRDVAGEFSLTRMATLLGVLLSEAVTQLADGGNQRLAEVEELNKLFEE
jgi:hypothetical protein